MKKTISVVLAALALAAPAFAASMTISFAADEGGDPLVITFDGEGTASVEGSEDTFAYTWNEETRELCGDATGEGEVCATMAESGDPEVGQSTAYTTSAGTSGTATITAMSE